MAIELGAFKQKAAEAKEAKAAQERAEAERVQAEQEAKGHEGELIAKELEAASQALTGAEASLAEAQQFAEAELASLAPEDQEAFRAQVAAEQQHAEELRLKMAELQGRKEAISGKPEAAEENLEELDLKELGKRLTVFAKEARVDGEALEKTIAEAAEDPSRREAVEDLRAKVTAAREEFLSTSAVFLKKLSSEKPDQVGAQALNIEAVAKRMTSSLSRRMKDEPVDHERTGYDESELRALLELRESALRAANPKDDEATLEASLIHDIASFQLSRIGVKKEAGAALADLYHRALKNKQHYPSFSGGGKVVTKEDIRSLEDHIPASLRSS